MFEKTLRNSDLAPFFGTQHWLDHPLSCRVYFTENVRDIVDFCNAYWIIYEIAIAQSLPNVGAEELQLWHLSVEINRTATLTCSDGGNRVIYTKPIEWTDFPRDELRLCFLDKKIRLPSEYWHCD